MSGKGGARAGAGRPKGSLNRRSVEVIAAAASKGITPLEYMLKVLRDENAEADARGWAAEKAAPYFHPKPAPLARTITLDLPPCDTADGVKDALAKVVAAVAAGEIAPVEASSLVAIIEAQRKAIETADILPRLEAIEAAQNAR